MSQIKTTPSNLIPIFLFLLTGVLFFNCNSSNNESKPSYPNPIKETKFDLLFNDNLAYVNAPDTTNQIWNSLIHSGFLCADSQKFSKWINEKSDLDEKHSFQNQHSKIADKDFNSLSAEDHFYHSFMFPESFSQSCSYIRLPVNSENNIPASLYYRTDGYIMSKRQKEAISFNRDSSILLMKNCIEENSLVGLPFKRVIVDLNAYELIPSLIKVLSNQTVKDPTILTTLCLLIKEDSNTFIKSPIYDHLYGGSKDGQITNIFDKGVPFTLKNMAFIISEAESFHSQKRVEREPAQKQPDMKQSTSFCFTSKKLDSLVIKDGQPRELTTKQFMELSALEHFIYAFSYKESYNQSCSIYPTPKNINEVIPANLIFEREGDCMSERQKSALSAHRDSTILLIKECSIQHQNVNLEFKRKIIELQAFELIPTLINLVKESNEYDPYLLTTLCLLMKNESSQFRESAIYKSLYLAPDDQFQQKFFERNVEYSKEKESFILSLAKEFYDLKLTGPSDFIKVPTNSYIIGSENNQLNPLREVFMQSFEISKYEITNAQFEQFVEETGYKSTAEEKKDALVFRVGLPEFEWEEDSTAFWRFPNGVSEGGIADKMNHPVTCISYRDVQNYCRWSNLQLPTIEQWEIAARAGSERKYFYSEGEEIYEYANVWHGENHLNISEDEDYITTSPIGSFKPNQLGLYDIYGNVFEFCSNKPEDFNSEWNVMITRGGSWWCSKASCSAFNSEDLGRVNINASFSNNGFRVVR